MIMVGFDFVIVLLALDMHEVQLINRATALQPVDRAIDRRAIDTRIFVFWQARAGLPRRDAGANPGYADDQPPLFRGAYRVSSTSRDLLRFRLCFNRALNRLRRR